MQTNAINPPKVVKQQNFTNPFDDAVQNKQSEDWLFETIEDSEDRGIVSCGFSDGPHTDYWGNLVGGNVKRPSIIKTDRNLDFLWRYDMNDNQTIFDSDGNNCNVILDGGSTRCSDIVEFNAYYYVIAFAKIKRTLNNITYTTNYRPIIMKFSKDGNIQTGYPRVMYQTNYSLNSSITADASLKGMTIDIGKGTLILCGALNGYQWVVEYDISNNTVVASNQFNIGVFLDVCPVYVNGSGLKKMPVTSNQAPTQYAFVGYNKKCTTCNQGDNDVSDAILISTNTSFSKNAEKIFDASALNSSSYNNNYQRGVGGASTCPSETSFRNSNDLASKVEQLKNGKLCIAINYNYTLLINNQFNAPFNYGYLCNAANVQSVGREQIVDTDGFIGIMIPNFNSTTTPERLDHVAHFNGDDFEFSITQDYTGDRILGIGTIADNYRLTVNTHRDEYWVFKYNPDWSNSSGKGNIDWEMSVTGAGTSTICAFDIQPTHKGGIICVGNNYRTGENFDLLLLGRDCETNQTLTPPFDLGPNMPDGKTFSVQQFLSSGNTLNMYSSRNIHAQVRVETGYTWHIHNGCTLKFMNNENMYDSAKTSDLQHSIIVEQGASMIMEPNTMLTSYTGCGDAVWGGILLKGNATPNVQDGGLLEMTDATIENAVVGVSAVSGSILKCSNAPITNARSSTINFKNCRRSVNLSFWVGNTPNASFFKYVNFLGDAPVNEYNGEGIKDFISLWDNNNLKIWGCSFRNTYTGTYRNNNRGIGITSFNVNANLIKGSNPATVNGNCSFPIGSTNLFEGLDVGFWNGGNTINNVIRIYGNEFKNVANPIFAGTGSSLKLYDNDLYWDNNFIQPPSTHPNYWVKGIQTGVCDGLNFDQNRINARTYIYPYTGMFLENVSDLFFSSAIFNNTTWNNPGTGLFGTAMFNSSSNTALDFTCNTYTNMMQDWYLGNNFRPRVGMPGQIGNNNKWTKPSGATNNILKLSGSLLEYFCLNTLPSSINTPNDGNNSFINFNVTRAPHGVQELGCNNTSPCLKYTYSLEDGGEHSGQMVVLFNQEYKQALDALNQNNFELARIKTNAISSEIENNNKRILLNILIPIFEQHRQYAMTAAEMDGLMVLTIGTEHENEYARNVLTFFADKTFTPNYSPLPANSASASANNTTNANPLDIFTVYPNPSNGGIALKIPSNLAGENTSIIITNIMGRKVYENLNYISNTAIDISAFANGMYLVSINQNGQIVYNTIVSKL
ncbi:MAG: T9SS type A sorting domain-containing protein [bacterium]|nr:T9SS type A sorting domain-containing protein [bacterium]